MKKELIIATYNHKHTQELNDIFLGHGWFVVSINDNQRTRTTDYHIRKTLWSWIASKIIK